MQHAIEEVLKLEPEEQDRIGRWLLDELAEEHAWGKKFAMSQDALGKLADEAMLDVERGKVTDLEVAKL